MGPRRPGGPGPHQERDRGRRLRGLSSTFVRRPVRTAVGPVVIPQPGRPEGGGGCGQAAGRARPRAPWRQIAYADPLPLQFPATLGRRAGSAGDGGGRDLGSGGARRLLFSKQPETAGCRIVRKGVATEVAPQTDNQRRCRVRSSKSFSPRPAPRAFVISAGCPARWSRPIRRRRPHGAAREAGSRCGARCRSNASRVLC